MTPAARAYLRCQGWVYDARRGWWVPARRRARQGVNHARR